MAQEMTRWLVPIRYWETSEPVRCDFIRDARTPADAPRAATSYVYHHGYSHNVYVHPDDLFVTRDAAMAEATRRASERDARLRAETDRILSNLRKEPAPAKSP